MEAIATFPEDGKVIKIGTSFLLCRSGPGSDNDIGHLRSKIS